MNEAKAASPTKRELIYRHPLIVRLSHWLNAIVMTVMLLSGLQIFNAHPALYLGDQSDFDHPVLQLGAQSTADGALIGVTTIFGRSFDTTGWLGVSRDADGDPAARGFPTWATLPSTQWLAMGRRWHFFFAWLFVLNGALYAVYALAGGHLRRDLLPSMGDLAAIPHTVWEHVRLRFPEGEAARRYNVLQKLSYLAVAFGLGPLIVLTGLTMSPRIDAGFPWLLSLFGGRQTARTIHFLCAFGFVAFVLVHLAMVLVSGVWNNLRSMITGRYAITLGGGQHG